MSTGMSGLRVYVNAPSTNLTSVAIVDGTINGDTVVFYSRRGNGPIYRWLYEAKLAHWRPSRVNTSDINPHRLTNASWKSVPETLQAQLGQHYLD